MELIHIICLMLSLICFNKANKTSGKALQELLQSFQLVEKIFFTSLNFILGNKYILSVFMAIKEEACNMMRIHSLFLLLVVYNIDDRKRFSLATSHHSYSSANNHSRSKSVLFRVNNVQINESNVHDFSLKPSLSWCQSLGCSNHWFQSLCWCFRLCSLFIK